MGACASVSDEDEDIELKVAKGPKCESSATIRQIRERLEEIFGILDEDRDGEISFMEATRFIMKSRRNLIEGAKHRAEVEDDVSRMFAMVDIDHTKRISADEFIAVYSNIFYPQRLTMTDFNKALKKMFGRKIVNPDGKERRGSAASRPSRLVDPRTSRKGRRTSTSKRRESLPTVNPTNNRHLSI
ncbi:hypothetical protein AAMO2058_000173300 [Amorphochlora amoebiformis]|uniref:EF-hand domain-containing protein n=1 Tax=Amorphochlora amoebiformis TaxID=1561963 RepID=A0A7S0H4G5_9EUKA|mmetsp:Transcript_9651/g.15263  ORF Transcript_9651/g.15263 Transcript_9651/m.15263 type:complete len:186 (+) Transcript_9651:16-573(+)